MVHPLPTVLEGLTCAPAVHDCRPLPSESPRDEPPLLNISQAEFTLLERLVYRESGIKLAEGKRSLVVARLRRRIEALGLRTFRGYCEFVEQDATGKELVQMLDCISTNETRFFRVGSHFELLEKDACARWREEVRNRERPKRVRVWSAGCATGEEPYSIAMVLASALPPALGWEISVLGTDLSTRALEAAREGVWSVTRAEQIPHRFLKSYMLRGIKAQAGYMAAGPELRKLLGFQRLNLFTDVYPEGPFDAIFCRNVLIYFSRESRRIVLERLVRLLVPGGLLFLGESENLQDPMLGLKRAIPNVYRLLGRS
jgi:chemotaxis protein methyltransferase CheR